MSVRIGFIGTGGIATSHLGNLLQIPEAEVVALCDLSTDRVEAARQVVHEHQDHAQANSTASQTSPSRRLDAVAYDDYGKMLQNERLDAVYLCLPPFAHGAPEEAVIKAGTAMLVEKPVALDIPVAARVLKSIKERGIIAASGYQMRYTTTLQQARDMIADRTVGMAVVMRFGRTPGTPWYHLQNKSGGQLIEMATHQIDMLRFLIGDIQTVYAAGATRINQQKNPAYDIFDVNCMTLNFENGAVANFANNFVAPFGSPPAARGLHIFCDGLTLSLDSTLRAVYEDRTDEFPVDAEPMLSEDLAFVQAVGEQRPELIRSDYSSGLRTLAVTVAGDRSARSGQPIDVRELLAAEAPGA